MCGAEGAAGWRGGCRGRTGGNDGAACPEEEAANSQPCWSMSRLCTHHGSLPCVPKPRKKQCLGLCKETSILALGCPRWAQLVLCLVLN